MRCYSQRGWHRGWLQGLESNTAQYPVNRWIVAGEPVVAEYRRTAAVQRSYIESNCLKFASWKMDWNHSSLSDGSISRTIKKFQRNGGYGTGR